MHSKQLKCSKSVTFQNPFCSRMSSLVIVCPPCWILTTCSCFCLGHFDSICNSSGLSHLFYLKFCSCVKLSLKVTLTGLLFLNPLKYWAISDQVSFLKISWVQVLSSITFYHLLSSRILNAFQPVINSTVTAAFGWGSVVTACCPMAVMRWDVPLLGTGAYLFLLAFAAFSCPYGAVCFCPLEMEKVSEICRVAFYAWQVLQHGRDISHSFLTARNMTAEKK